MQSSTALFLLYFFLVKANFCVYRMHPTSNTACLSTLISFPAFPPALPTAALHGGEAQGSHNPIMASPTSALRQRRETLCQEDLPAKHTMVKLHSRGQGQALIFP